MSRPAHSAGRRLWGVAAVFNPTGSSRRLANYRAFRRELQVPLVTVELAYGPDFELGTDDADIMLRLRGRDVLWQKERLLNLALRALPVECDSVAWLDADIVFERPDWPELALAELEHSTLVQPFRDVRDRPAKRRRGDHVASVTGISRQRRGARAASHCGRAPGECLAVCGRTRVGCTARSPGPARSL